MNLNQALLFLTRATSFTFAPRCLASSTFPLREAKESEYIISTNYDTDKNEHLLNNKIVDATYDNTSSRFLNSTRDEWPLIGDVIYGFDYGSEAAGFSTAISYNGKRIAIGSPHNVNYDSSKNTGHTRVFREMKGQWIQVGEAIVGVTHEGRSGHRVDISDNGKRVVIGAPWDDGNGDRSGRAQVFGEVNGKWVQLGNDMNGEFPLGEFGTSVKISGDGRRVIAGAPFNNDGVGRARILQLIKGSWVQIGNSIDGRVISGGTEERLGFDVDISQDGKRVIVGSPSKRNVGALSPGFARVYEENKGEWIQVGDDIKGDEPRDGAGWAVNMSSNGSRVVVAAPWNDERSGVVRIYEEKDGAWKKVGNDIVGFFKSHVDISADGRKVIVGSPILVEVFEMKQGQWEVVSNIPYYYNDADSVGISGDGWRVILGVPSRWGYWKFGGIVNVFGDNQAPPYPTTTEAPTQSPGTKTPTVTGGKSRKSKKKASKSEKATKAPKDTKSAKIPKGSKSAKSAKSAKSKSASKSVKTAKSAKKRAL